MKKSVKQQGLERKIIKLLPEKSRGIAEYIFQDQEIQTMQDFANIVSIKRLGYNDHGPVHMRTAALNSLTMFDLLHKAEIKFNLEKEGLGNVEDSRIVVLMASLLHDLGMTISRSNHEYLSVIIAQPIINRILEKFYQDSPEKIPVLRAVAIEGIFGHMGTQSVNSLEAGLVLIGDGCDMEMGRSRISTLLSNLPRVGDIHKYSSSSIEKVIIEKGDKKPIKITVKMNSKVGVFQVEEVLFPKINSSSVKQYIQLIADIKGEEQLKYL